MGARSDHQFGKITDLAKVNNIRLTKPEMNNIALVQRRTMWASM